MSRLRLGPDASGGRARRAGAMVNGMVNGTVNGMPSRDASAAVALNPQHLARSLTRVC